MVYRPAEAAADPQTTGSHHRRRWLPCDFCSAAWSHYECELEQGGGLLAGPGRTLFACADCRRALAPHSLEAQLAAAAARRGEAALQYAQTAIGAGEYSVDGSVLVYSRPFLVRGAAPMAKKSPLVEATATRQAALQPIAAPRAPTAIAAGTAAAAGAPSWAASQKENRPAASSSIAGREVTCGGEAATTKKPRVLVANGGLNGGQRPPPDFCGSGSSRFAVWMTDSEAACSLPPPQRSPRLAVFPAPQEAAAAAHEAVEVTAASALLLLRMKRLPR